MIISIMNLAFVMDTQARGRVSNSAPNSLPTCGNSAAGQPGQIVPKPLISHKFSALRGGYLEADRRFSPAGREMPTERAVAQPRSRHGCRARVDPGGGRRDIARLGMKRTGIPRGAIQ